jgi:tetratricopeptide (TPR) repeat protein
MRSATRVCAGLLVVATTVAWPAAQQRITTGPPAPVQEMGPVDEARRYLKELGRHVPGAADQGATTIARMPAVETRAAIEAVVGIAQTLFTAIDRDAKAGKPQPFRFRGRTYTRAQFSVYLGLAATDPFPSNPNETLRRAAMMHADIAMLVTDTAAPDPTTVTSLMTRGLGSVRHTVETLDGQVVEMADNSLHWDYARQLLDAVRPNPSQDAWIRRWYLATTAWQADQRKWSDALLHCTHAMQIFPAESRFAFGAGVVHEVLALPALQAARGPSAPMVDDARSELEAAVPLLRAAVNLDAADAEQHLHYGRVLSALGRFRDAETELQKAGAGLRDPNLQYYASLFLGYNEGAMGDRPAATASFERAATAFPHAQAPLLGLSQLARQFDDRDGAAAALARFFALPKRQYSDEPWWDYDHTHGRLAGSLLAAVRANLQ